MIGLAATALMSLAVAAPSSAARTGGSTPDVGVVSSSFSAGTYYDAGNGYVFWGCHLTIRAPLTGDLRAGTYYVEYAARGPQTAGTFAPIGLLSVPTRTTVLSYTTPGVFLPTESVTDVQVTLYRNAPYGRNSVLVDQSRQTVNPPYRCPAEPTR